MPSNDLMPPSLLLGIPALPTPEGYFNAGILTLTIEQAEGIRKHYFDQVSYYLDSHSIDTERELVPVVEWALRLYNAENFTGELGAAEREQLRAVYERFSGCGLLPLSHLSISSGESGTDDKERGTAGEKSRCNNKAPIYETFLLRLLASDGEMPRPCTRMGGLLLCILAIVTSTVTNKKGFQEPRFPLSSLWCLRAHFRHQLCLEHRAHSVFLKLSACVDAILCEPDEAISVGVLLEVGHIQSYYYHRELATQTFLRAARRSGLMLKDEVIMGVRTRWQRHQLLQAVLNANSSRAVPEDSITEEQPHTVMPEKEGHDILDRPREMPESGPLPVTPLHPEDKAILLALCMDEHSRDVNYDLARYRALTYIERLMADPAPSPFVVRCQTLLVRARLEMERNRVRERAFMQFTELVEQYTARHDLDHRNFMRTKSKYFYTVSYPSIWALKAEYANLCFDESLYKTALDIYEEILDWENIIECCKKLDKRRKVESLARELLEKDPNNPALWVALGEATREEAHLWKAWKLSGHKMAAPMRALARLALERKNYADTVRYFDEAVRINPVFGGDWFTLGYASLKLQLWERSAEAFTRVCQIDPEDAWAWNNLATIMLRENKLRPAFNAMSQALRNNRRDWRMWLNYFHIGTRLKEVLETTNTLAIILDIGKRNVSLDYKIMEMFVDNTIAYLKGEIRGTSADNVAEGEEMRSDAVRFKSIASTAEACPEALIQHVPVSVDPSPVDHHNSEVESESDAVACADLRPVGTDSSDPEIWNLERARVAQKNTTHVILPDIRRRHEKRLRELFARLLETFVSDPDLYSCAARLFRYLDGPFAGYYYRVKELRVCRQKDQWERDKRLFQRTVTCLSALVDDVVAMAEAERAGSLAANAQEVDSNLAQKAPNATSDYLCNNAVDLSTEKPASQAGLSEITAPLEQVQAHISAMNALQATLDNIQVILSTTTEYMASTEEFGQLNMLCGRLHAVLQQLNSSIV